MGDITDKTENLSFKVMAKPSIAEDRRVQITITIC
jgi:hypothetical protein